MAFLPEVEAPFLYVDLPYPGSNPAEIEETITRPAEEALATLPEKADALRPLAAERDLPLYSVAVAGIETPTRSPRIEAMHGTGSVAEAAALVAAGTGARITVARITAPDGMATCAMAEVEGRQE